MKALVAALIAKLSREAQRDDAGEVGTMPAPRKPATAAQLAALERTLGFRLPPSYREFLRVCDGIENFAGTHLLLGTRDHGSRRVRKAVDEVTEYWQNEDGKPVDVGIPVAVPDADDGIRNLWAFAEDARGREREVIDWDTGRELKRHPSFRAFLEDQLAPRKTKAAPRAKPKAIEPGPPLGEQPAKGRPKNLGLPHDAKLEAALVDGKRGAFAKYGAWLTGLGHPLGEVITADVAAEMKPKDRATRNHAVATFERYVKAQLASRFPLLAPKMAHFTNRTGGYVHFRFGFLADLDSFGCGAPVRKQMLELLADDHGAWLNDLTLRDVALEDLSLMSRFRALRKLNLRWARLGGLRSLGPLAELRNLRALDVRKSAIEDLAPLRALPIVQLVLRESAVVDLRPLEGHPTLEDIDLNGCKVQDIRPLLSCPRLVAVNLWDTKVPAAKVGELVASMKKTGARPTRNAEGLMHGTERGVSHNTAGTIW